jgi:outer membrane protein assembly factor BamB
MVHALDAKSGSENWTFATKSGIDSSPVIVGERVFIGAGDGRLYGLNLTNGEKVFEYEAGGGGFSASPAVAEGRLVIGNNDGELFCFGAP